MSAQNELQNKINDFLEYLEVEKGSSPLTLRNYRHYLNRFTSWLVAEGYSPKISEINPELVRHYRVYLSRLDLSRRTQGYHAIALRSLLKWLTKMDIKVMAPEKIDLPKVEDRKVKFLSGDQVDRLLNAPSLSTSNGKRDKVDLDRREFGVVGKGGRARVVFLSSRAAVWLGKYLDARRDNHGPLFIHHIGRTDTSISDEKMRLTPRSVQRMVKKYVRKIKLPVEATPHVLRRSFATDLLMAGADIRSVQEMLGHKNISTTQIYTHVTNKQLKEIHEAFHGKGR